MYGLAFANGILPFVLKIKDTKEKVKKDTNFKKG